MLPRRGSSVPCAGPGRSCHGAPRALGGHRGSRDSSAVCPRVRACGSRHRRAGLRPPMAASKLSAMGPRPQPVPPQPSASGTALVQPAPLLPAAVHGCRFGVLRPASRTSCRPRTWRCVMSLARMRRHRIRGAVSVRRAVGRDARKQLACSSQQSCLWPAPSSQQSCTPPAQRL